MEKVKRYVRVFTNLLKMQKFDMEVEDKKNLISIHLYNVNGPASVALLNSMILKCGFIQTKKDFYTKDGVRLTTTFMENIGCGVVSFSKEPE